MKLPNQRIRFVGVGRPKASWEVTVDGLVTESDVVSAVRRKGCVVSRDLSVTMPEGDLPGRIFVGGFRKVGTFFVE